MFTSSLSGHEGAAVFTSVYQAHLPQDPSSLTRTLPSGGVARGLFICSIVLVPFWGGVAWLCATQL